MRGDLIRVLSAVEEKANELKMDGYQPDIVLFGTEAYEYVKAQVAEEFGGDEEVLELSGVKVRVLDELDGDGVIVDSTALGLGVGGARRFKVVK